MKNVLDHTVPHQAYFEEMTRIPHGSYHEAAYSDYLVRFAKEHSLQYKQDAMYNVIIYKGASLGYEDHPPLLLQAHMDMVCEKNEDTVFDFETDALKLYIEDGFLKAEGTTLGADDGTGVAYMLALLDDAQAKHPALECVFTVQEEVGLFGAMAIEKQDIHAKRMINLDDGGELATCITSAGGINVILQKERILVPVHTLGYRLEVKGLAGGHSGGDIHLERGNANILVARTLYQIDKKFGLQLHSICGGCKDNAIPREANAMFVCGANEQEIQACVEQIRKDLLQEYSVREPKLSIMLTKAEVKQAMSTAQSASLIRLLLVLPNGVRTRSMEIEGLVNASSNIGVVDTKENIMINCSIRGALASYVDALKDEVEILAEAFSYESACEARYPSWSYTKESFMREKLKEVCQSIYGKELECIAVHGGLECGVFKALDEEMDIVTMGPIANHIHTPQEELSIASFDRTYHFLKTYIEAL